ncbi:hypothetical protein CHELA17_60516 [Chelatococcus asaccharovorans]|nr:hypothetical protein CHELA17_60516 [Chelatococcus asaccharovorans]
MLRALVGAGRRGLLSEVSPRAIAHNRHLLRRWHLRNRVKPPRRSPNFEGSAAPVLYQSGNAQGL